MTFSLPKTTAKMQKQDSKC